MNKLTVVLVNYNSKDYLESCLDSLYHETKVSGYQVVVVDNASEDRDFSPLEKKYPQLHFLLNCNNLGFATAVNQGVRRHPAQFYLLLNPDSRILNGAVDKTLKFLTLRPEVAVVGCRVNNPDGSLQLACRRSIPRPSIALYRLLKLSFLFPTSERFSRYNLSFMDSTQPHEVEAVSGSFLMFRNQLLEDIGYLDENFFLYGEDLDFCYRALLKGWKIFYYPKAQIVHYKYRSATSNVGRSTFHYYKAMEIFYRKHFYRQAGPLQNLLVFSAIRFLYFSNRLRKIFRKTGEIGSDF